MSRRTRDRRDGGAAVSCDCLAHRGNAADRGAPGGRIRPICPTPSGQAIRPLIPLPAWMGGRGGRPEGYCHREMIDAVRYLIDNGIKWRAMPRDFPGWVAVYRFFRRWRDQGLTGLCHDRLRRGPGARGPRAGTDPRAVSTPSRCARRRPSPQNERGYDGGKRINGTKRHIAVDTIGLLLAVLVTAAGVQDRDGAMPLLKLLRAAARASRGYGPIPRTPEHWSTGPPTRRPEPQDRQAQRRHDGVRGACTPLGGGTHAVVDHPARRCVRDYERRDETHEAMRWAMTLVMTRRLGRQGH